MKIMQRGTKHKYSLVNYIYFMYYFNFNFHTFVFIISLFIYFLIIYFLDFYFFIFRFIISQYYGSDLIFLYILYILALIIMSKCHYLFQFCLIPMIDWLVSIHSLAQNWLFQNVLVQSVLEQSTVQILIFDTGNEQRDLMHLAGLAKVFVCLIACFLMWTGFSTILIYIVLGQHFTLLNGVWNYHFCSSITARDIKLSSTTVKQ